MEWEPHDHCAYMFGLAIHSFMPTWYLYKIPVFLNWYFPLSTWTCNFSVCFCVASCYLCWWPCLPCVILPVMHTSVTKCVLQTSCGSVFVRVLAASLPKCATSCFSVLQENRSATTAHQLFLYAYSRRRENEKWCTFPPFSSDFALMECSSQTAI